MIINLSWQELGLILTACIIIKFVIEVRTTNGIGEWWKEKKTKQ